MGPVFGVWRASERKLLRRVHRRLSLTGGCDAVRYEPSRIDPDQVLADVDPVAFLASEYPAVEATLRVEFDLSGDRPFSWIQWWEPDRGRGFGWHADDTEPEYGPVHLQVDYPDGTTGRKSAAHVTDEHPYRTFERRLAGIPVTLRELEWP